MSYISGFLTLVQNCHKGRWAPQCSFRCWDDLERMSPVSLFIFMLFKMIFLMIFIMICVMLDVQIISGECLHPTWIWLVSQKAGMHSASSGRNTVALQNSRFQGMEPAITGVPREITEWEEEIHAAMHHLSQLWLFSTVCLLFVRLGGFYFCF